jgi:hypothetical protein
VNGMRGPFLLPAARSVPQPAGDRHASLPEIVCIPRHARQRDIQDTTDKILTAVGGGSAASG